MLRRGYLHDLPKETLDIEHLMSFPGRHYFTHALSQLVAEGIKCILCDPIRKGPWEAWAWFLPNFSPGPFPFVDFALHAFAIINNCYEYNYMLSPVSPPSESPNLGDLTHIS